MPLLDLHAFCSCCSSLLPLTLSVCTASLHLRIFLPTHPCIHSFPALASRFRSSPRRHLVFLSLLRSVLACTRQQHISGHTCERCENERRLSGNLRIRYVTKRKRRRTKCERHDPREKAPSCPSPCQLPSYQNFHPQQIVGSSMPLTLVGDMAAAVLGSKGSRATCTIIQSHRNLPTPAPRMMLMMM